MLWNRSSANRTLVLQEMRVSRKSCQSGKGDNSAPDFKSDGRMSCDLHPSTVIQLCQDSGFCDNERL